MQEGKWTEIALNQAVENLKTAIDEYGRAVENTSPGATEYELKRHGGDISVAEELISKFGRDNSTVALGLKNRQKELVDILNLTNLETVQKVANNLNTYCNENYSTPKNKETPFLVMLNHTVLSAIYQPIYNDRKEKEKENAWKASLKEARNKETAPKKEKLEEHINNREYEQALDLLVKNSELINIKLNLNSNINNDPNNNTPLKVFIMAGRLDDVKALLDRGAKITIPDGHGIKSHDALSTMLSALENNPPKTNIDKIEYGNIAAELLNRDEELQKIVEENKIYEHAKNLGLTASPKLNTIVENSKLEWRSIQYGDQIKQIDKVVSKLTTERDKLKPTDSDYKLKTTKIDSLTNVKTAMINGNDALQAIKTAQNTEGVTAGIISHKTRDLLEKLEKNATPKNPRNEKPFHTSRGPGRS